MAEPHEHESCEVRLNAFLQKQIEKGFSRTADLAEEDCCICQPHEGCELFELATKEFKNDGTQHVRMNKKGQIEVEKPARPAPGIRNTDSKGWEERFDEMCPPDICCDVAPERMKAFIREAAREAEERILYLIPTRPNDMDLLAQCYGSGETGVTKQIENQRRRASYKNYAEDCVAFCEKLAERKLTTNRNEHGRS